MSREPLQALAESYAASSVHTARHSPVQPDAGATNWTLPKDLPRRWLIVTQNYAPERGASQARLGILARILKELGLEVEVFTGMPYYPTGIIPPKYRGRWTHRETIDGITVHRTWVYPYMGYNKLLRMWNFTSFTMSALVNLFRVQRPNVLFIESFPLPVGLLGLLARNFWQVPFIYNIPDMQVQAAREMWLRNEWLLWAATKFENFVIRQSWRTSTVTYGFRDHFIRDRKLPAEKFSMLPNGADLKMFRPRDPDPELIHKFALAGKIVFLYAGTIGRAHAPQVLIDAAELLRDRDDIRILIVGGGPERAAIMDSARDKGLTNVIFGAESFAPEELPALMSLARAALVTLSDTPIHRILRVAKTWPPMACGKPVIFCGECESGEMVRRNDCGIVTLPEDAVPFADAIRRLADDEAEARRLGESAQRFVESQLGWRDIVRRFLTDLAKTPRNA